MSVFCRVDRAVLHAGLVTSRASDLGSHYSPRIGTSLWPRRCARHATHVTYATRTGRRPFASAVGQPAVRGQLGATHSPTVAACGASCSPQPGQMPSRSGGQMLRNTFTRLYLEAAADAAVAPLALVRPVRSIKLSSRLLSVADTTLQRGGAPFLYRAGRTNALTIAPPSHRSRHFCCADATVCRSRAGNALSCERPPNHG